MTRIPVFITSSKEKITEDICINSAIKEIILLFTPKLT